MVIFFGFDMILIHLTIILFLILLEVSKDTKKDPGYFFFSFSSFLKKDLGRIIGLIFFFLIFPEFFEYVEVDWFFFFFFLRKLGGLLSHSEIWKICEEQFWRFSVFFFQRERPSPLSQVLPGTVGNLVYIIHLIY